MDDEQKEVWSRLKETEADRKFRAVMKLFDELEITQYDTEMKASDLPPGVFENTLWDQINKKEEK